MRRASSAISRPAGAAAGSGAGAGAAGSGAGSGAGTGAGSIGSGGAAGTTGGSNAIAAADPGCRRRQIRPPASASRASAPTSAPVADAAQSDDPAGSGAGAGALAVEAGSDVAATAGAVVAVSAGDTAWPRGVGAEGCCCAAPVDAGRLAARLRARLGVAPGAGLAAPVVAGWAGADAVGRGRITGLSLSTGPAGRAVGLAVPGGRLKTSWAGACAARPAASAIRTTAFAPATIFTVRLPFVCPRGWHG